MWRSPALAAMAAAVLLVACGSPPAASRSPSAPASPSQSPPTPAPAPPGPVEPTLQPTPTLTPIPSPEWRLNLRPNAQTFTLRRPVGLLNLETGEPVATVPAGTLTVAYETSAGGRAYWMTDYSVSRGLPNGMLKSAVEEALAAPALPASLITKEWTRLPTSRRVVALTFDAGAGDTGLSRILAALAAARAPATFFLTGRWAERYPGAARQVAGAYPIGNHTYSHPDLTTLAGADVETEITGGAAAIQAVTGVDPHPLFRFPYGARDARTIRIANELGYGGIRWTVDTLGWKGAASGQSAGSVQQRVLDGLTPGEIVIMHVGAAEDGSTLDADALPGVIAAIRARGYELVAVSDFL